MSAAEEHLADVVRDLTARHEVQTTLDRMAKTAVVPFDEQVQKLIARTADDLGLDYAQAMSGAGHDAQEISAICPTAMIFVAGENNGISHTPPRSTQTPAPAATEPTSSPTQSSGWLIKPTPKRVGPRVLCFPNYQIRGLRAYVSSDSSATQSSGR
jgi:hypothetical protein